MDKDDLFDIATQIDQCVDSLRKFRSANSLTLSSVEKMNIQITEARLEDISTRIRAVAIRGVLTNLNDAKHNIQSLTQKAIDEIETFKRINDALNVIADLLKVGSAILNVITGLKPSPAEISPPL
ncbi:hypothetical protein C7B61_20360 [filamentous cyanobacterium CCP1]|nr:hypothetical protein C7B76_13835 [filamentous cyanobacterium CCP2]PSB56693.1 hypothetical protein C7B61_20360 [filamentous cyanobacterium CCP1]